MKTRQMVIDELADFVAQLYIDGKPDMGNVNGIVVIAYNPDELGVEDDEWHLLMDTYSTAKEAMEFYLTRHAESKCIVTWNADSNWTTVLAYIDEQFGLVINKIKSYKHEKAD